MSDLLIKLTEYQQIETKRLFLRPISLADAEDMYEYASDDETTRFVFEKHESLAATKEAIAQYFLAAPLGKYAIILKETGKMIGTIDYHNIEVDLATAEIGYTLNQLYWRQGITTEACRELIKIGFEKIGFNRLDAVHDLKNPHSGAVMKKAGLIFKENLPYAKKVGDEFTTNVWYRLTKEEYFHV